MIFTYKGSDGKAELEKILNAKPEKKEPKRKVITPKISGNLSFVTDENLYKEICKYIKLEHPNLENKFTFEGVMKQSNAPLAVAVDMYLKSTNSEYRLATQLDLESNLDFTKGTYNDSGLALRNLTGANSEQAKYLFEQLKKKGIKESAFPLVIFLQGLELTNDLNYNLTEESIYTTAKCLNWASGTPFSKVNKFGLLEKEDKTSSRKIWTNKDCALAGCYLDSDSNLNSNNSSLLNSNDDGRVVLAKPRSG